MARITIEDCIEQVPNRFQLVQMAAIRAKQLKKGARALLQNEENKEIVLALREIAAGLVKKDVPAPEDEFAAEAPPVVPEAPASEAAVAVEAAAPAEAEASADDAPAEEAAESSDEADTQA